MLFCNAFATTHSEGGIKGGNGMASFSAIRGGAVDLVDLRAGKLHGPAGLI